MACSMTWAHQDSPLRATNAAAASRLGSASAARIRGSWKSSGAGSTTSSITSPSINHVASSSIDVVLFYGHRTSMSFELQGVLVGERYVPRGQFPGGGACAGTLVICSGAGSAALADAAGPAHGHAHGGHTATIQGPLRNGSASR